MDKPGIPPVAKGTVYCDHPPCSGMVIRAHHIITPCKLKCPARLVHREGSWFVEAVIPCSEYEPVAKEGTVPGWPRVVEGRSEPAEEQ